MDKSLSKLWEIVEDAGDWWSAIREVEKELDMT